MPNPVIAKMMDRLFASMINGPSLNCRPHASRQRLDLAQLQKLQDLSPGDVVTTLLGPDRRARVSAKSVPPRGGTAIPFRLGLSDTEPPEELSPEELAVRRAWKEQESVLAKLRVIVEDAKTYEQDTGAHVLNLGFPLLSLPPNTLAGGQARLTRRIIAPVAFVPVSVTVKQGTRREVEIRCRAGGVDLVTPNTALLAWLEKQSGEAAVELFADENGEDPWREIAEIVRRVCHLVQVEPPAFLQNWPPSPGHARSNGNGDGHDGGGGGGGHRLEVEATPRTEQLEDKAAVLPCGVLGLFPVANQGLLRDTQAMAAGESLAGPVESFIRLDAGMEARPDSETGQAQPDSVEKRTRVFAEERLVSDADPCQSRSVRLARQCKGLVVHGPPGTGKSQTITNVIGDHLARGQRVLVVCDKRTALDVVANRMEYMGLGHLCALVHDPQRDQRELYKSIRQQLDDLTDATGDPGAERRLEQLDAELDRLHGEMTRYHQALWAPDSRTRASFHDLMGHWLTAARAGDGGVRPELLKPVTLDLFQRQREQDVHDLLDRSAASGYATSPWRGAVGVELGAFLVRPMAELREVMDACAADATEADATADPAIPPFAAEVPLVAQAAARTRTGGALDVLMRSADPAVLAVWAGRDAAAAAEARRLLDEAARHWGLMRKGPLDADLAGRVGQAPPAAAEVARSWKVLKDYAEAFGKLAARFAAIRRAAPAARLQTITHWVSRGPDAAAKAKRRVDDMRTLADAVAAVPLDRSMLLQFKREPFDVRELIRRVGLLNQYIESSAGFLAFLKTGPKKDAAPIAQYFGVALSPESAKQMRDFLAALRSRLELKSELEDAGILREPLPPVPSDDELLGAYGEHRDTLTAVLSTTTTDPSKAPSPQAEHPAPADPSVEEVAAIHSLIGAHVEAAGKVLGGLGLSTGPREAARAKSFLNGLNSRLALQALHAHLNGTPVTAVAATPLLSDDALERSLSGHLATVSFLDDLAADPAAALIGGAVGAALRDATAHGPTLVQALARSAARAQAVERLTDSLRRVGLFTDAWLDEQRGRLLAGEKVEGLIESLRAALAHVEGVIRVKAGLDHLPAALREAVLAMVEAGTPATDGVAALRRAALSSEVRRRLLSDPTLQQVDGQRLKSCFERYRTMDRQKKEVVRDAIRHRWLAVQKQRLLASTAGRLNPLGASVRRRLTLQGERALRLRQVVAMGRTTEGGDPLFDLRPVWMASPETVAQLFPREPIFDLIVFDEASQCRLEEALPVLTRASRVVIAGDTKQLPPTRFFESAVAASDNEDVETDDQLFESQQGEIEDLLTAALNLDIQECYLDVHYRSRNGDLIQFSNEHFYKSRLQAIPGHPSGRRPAAPLKLIRADGIYEKRTNAVEARRVVELVRELLAGDNPPSIGIACFNLTQRDLIVDTLDELAEQDAEFGRKLAAARERQGAGSFEGLFVKNLENVQGDERDHIIVSTTYGPTPEGKFRRNFGPLSGAGGGRRLNVLVTRAREAVHVVTSIPPDAYRNLEALPAGRTPTGGWLLFAYLRDAERMAEEYELALRVLSQAQASQNATVEVKRHPEPFQPSRFAHALARQLAGERGMGSTVHWGNDGFCVDLALQHPTRAEDVTVGVLCDTTRFTLAEDPVEWDVFRTGVLENQGWVLHRVWTPHFFRDPAGGADAVARDVANYLAAGVGDDGARAVAAAPV